MSDALDALDRYLETGASTEAEIRNLRRSQEMAWILIANAYGGNWDLAPDDWRQAAIKWRDICHRYLETHPEPSIEKPIHLVTSVGL